METVIEEVLGFVMGIVLMVGIIFVLVELICD
jgi:hypothetical protein